MLEMVRAEIHAVHSTAEEDSSKRPDCITCKVIARSAAPEHVTKAAAGQV